MSLAGLGLLVALLGDAQASGDVAARPVQPPAAELVQLFASADALDADALGLELDALLSTRGVELLPDLRLVLTQELTGGSTELSAPERALVTHVAGSLGRAVVVAKVAGAAEEADRTSAARAADLALLTPVAEAGDLGLALRVAGASIDAPLEATLRRPLHELAAAVLERDPEAHPELVRSVSFLDPTATSPLVRALGSTAGPSAWGTLGTLLGEDPQLDRVTLSTIATLAHRHPGTAPALLVARVGEYLRDADPMLVRNALGALGALDAQGVHAEIVALLASPDATIRTDAHSALVALTGLGLPADPARWQAWLASEEAWWGQEAGRLFAEIQGGTLTDARAALATLARHRLHRDAIAERILPLLERESPPLRADACRALGALGARTSVQPLRALADSLDADDPIHAAADAALRALGASHGCDEVAAGALGERTLEVADAGN